MKTIDDGKFFRIVYQFFDEARTESGSFQTSVKGYLWPARAMLARAKRYQIEEGLRLGLAYALQHDEIPIEKWGGDDVVPEEPDARAALAYAFEQLWPGEDWRTIDTSDVTFE